MAEENVWQERSYYLVCDLNLAVEAARKAADASMAAYNNPEDIRLNFDRLSALVKFRDQIEEAYGKAVKLHNTPQTDPSIEGHVHAKRNELHEMEIYIRRAIVEVSKIGPTMFEFTALKTYEEDLRAMYRKVIELRILQTAQAA